MKLTIIINGPAGVGKDTVCEFAADEYNVVNVSAVDPIKSAARVLGWNGSKDTRSRKFLSDLKNLSIEHNDYPTAYLLESWRHFFIDPELEILFAHIREPIEIEKFRRAVRMEGRGPVVTLFVDSKRLKNKCNLGNSSDDNVYNYEYDYIFDNDGTIDESRERFRLFLRRVVANECGGYVW